MNRKTLSTSVPAIMVWLGLPGTIAAVTMVHAADSIGSHRLFFTPAQRMEASLTQDRLAPESLPDASIQPLAGTDDMKNGATAGVALTPRSIDPVKSRRRHLSTAPEENFEQDYRVFFSGLVTGMRAVQVLVNGLPCEPVPVENSRSSEDPVPISCHGVPREGLSLSVATRAGELLVTESGGRVYRLLPGEGM